MRRKEKGQGSVADVESGIGIIKEMSEYKGQSKGKS